MYNMTTNHVRENGDKEMPHSTSKKCNYHTKKQLEILPSTGNRFLMTFKYDYKYQCFIYPSFVKGHDTNKHSLEPFLQ